ncbi:MAG TPA: SAM-dependent methyltransferase [Anaerolineae bacterium]|nr:SAM-dependent methyltransferase [Anaerolineae bacterium]
MNRKTGHLKPLTRAPRFLPEWVKRRIEVNVYELYDYIGKAGALTPSDAFVLDAGAGEGRFKPEFAHTNYIGVDLAVGDVDWNYRDLDAICNLFSLPFENNKFDVALCLQTLEHVTEPFIVIKELTRVLKPGGRLYLSAPQSWHQHQKPHDYYRYTSFGLKFLFEKANLIVEEIKPMGGYFWFLSFQLQNINYWLFPRGMKGRRWTWPLRAINGLIFQLILPLFLFYLDPLDKTKDETFGYICTAIKPYRSP